MSFLFPDIVRIAGTEDVWYLASPYSKYPKGKEAAYDKIADLTTKLWGARVKAFSPIVNSVPIEQRMPPMPHEWWMAMDEAFMNVSHGMIYAMMEGHEQSLGMKLEVKHFQKAGKPILFWDIGE